MALRIHLTAQDLARTVVLPSVGPLAETMFAVGQLRAHYGGTLFGGWREDGKVRLRGGLGLLRALLPADGVGLEPVTLAPHGSTLDESLEQLRAQPLPRLRAEICHLFAHHPGMPAWSRRLAVGDTELLDRLNGELRLAHCALVEPYWARIRAQLAVGHATLTNTMIRCGVGGVLAALHPSVRWNPPVLEVRKPYDWDVHLDGRGLTIVTSLFCWPRPHVGWDTLIDPHPGWPRPAGSPARVGMSPFILVIPSVHAGTDLASVWAGESGTGAALAALLGRTRAEALDAIGSWSPPGPTTTGLARRLRISPASASEHAAVLRQAGLVASRRTTNRVHHRPTQLGIELLRGDRSAEVG